MRLVELGSLAVHRDRVHRAAMPMLHELHRATGLVVHLAVLDGADVVYLDKVGDRMAAAIPTRVGGRHPAHCTAVGKAIMAHAGEGVLGSLGTDVPPQDQVLDRQPEPTAHRAEQGARTASRSTARESLAGFGCVAASIGDSGEAVGAVSVWVR